jgi:polyhydroxyalkanoate synthase
VRPSRVGPRPLALYLRLAALLAGMPELEQVWDGSARHPRSGSSATIAPERFLKGLRAYWRHPYRRRLGDPPAIWRRGPARLLDYGQGGIGPPVLVLPSLINRAYILDLMEERSLLRHLAAAGFRPFLLDWGPPDGPALASSIADHVLGPAQGALDAVLAATGGRPPALIGYCMGGLLACALGSLREADLAGLVLLATPWDFHAGPSAAPLLLGGGLVPLAATIGTLGHAPVELLQGFFALLDPARVIRKFERFADLPADSPAATLFVAVEDWLNDGVPLAGPVAQECLWHWYVENRPGCGSWTVNGVRVEPWRLRLPMLAAVPAHDRIVPAASAGALAALLPDATVIRPASGHVGMIVGDTAPRQLWQPLGRWLRRIAPRRSGRTVRPASAIA